MAYPFTNNSGYRSNIGQINSTYIPQYSPSQPQIPNPQTFNVIWIDGGIEGVKSYPILPNQEAMFMDRQNPVLYTKKVNQYGIVESIEAFDLVPKEIKETSNTNVDMSDYAKVSDIENLISKLIDQKLDAYTSSDKKEE